jgi:hypothetical protein|tara:strand:+ start:957 stop:1655 length:699 start_codon:yes stop_codon:yes gene_type:complete
MKKLILIIPFLIPYLAISQEYPFDEKIYGYTLQQMDILINNEDNGYYYDDLLNKFYEGDSVMTQKEMLLTYYGFALMPGYKPYIWLDLENKIIKSNNDRNFKAAKALADSLVGMIPVSTMANEELSYALGRTRDSIGSKFYRKQYQQLLNIIINSGDGKSKETAYKVIGMKDISVITQVKKMQVLKQKRTKSKNHVFEVLTVFYKYEQQKIYFDITLIETLGLKSIQKKKKK